VEEVTDAECHGCGDAGWLGAFLGHVQHAAAEVEERDAPASTRPASRQECGRSGAGTAVQDRVGLAYSLGHHQPPSTLIAVRSQQAMLQVVARRDAVVHGNQC
jgi:hypothetical protein